MYHQRVFFLFSVLICRKSDECHADVRRGFLSIAVQAEKKKKRCELWSFCLALTDNIVSPFVLSEQEIVLCVCFVT